MEAATSPSDSPNPFSRQSRHISRYTSSVCRVLGNTVTSECKRQNTPARVQVASCRNAHRFVRKAATHRSTLTVGRGWDSGASMLTLSVPINHNLPFKRNGRELRFHGFASFPRLRFISTASLRFHGFTQHLLLQHQSTVHYQAG